MISKDYFEVPLVTTLSPVMEISQRMVKVSLGSKFNWGCLSSEWDTNLQGGNIFLLKKMAEITSVDYLANPLLSLGRFFSKVYSHRLALVFTPSLSTILKMMSALMGTWGGTINFYQWNWEYIDKEVF